MKVAIVHDWLVGGGAERVVEQLHIIYPDAPIYTSYCSDEWRAKLDGKVVTGWLQHFGKLRKYMVLGRIWWFTHLDLSEYDLVISSSGNGEAKSIWTGANTTHICYCHAPTHYYWRHYEQYIKQPGFGRFNWLARLGLRILVGPLRWWDKHRASQRPDYYIANSSHTASEIKKFYGRDATVIHPPVDIERFKVKSPAKRHGFVTVGRQTGYKHVDIIIEACNKLKLPLTVVGRGPEHNKLVKMAGPTISFETDLTDQEVPKAMASAEAFIFAAYEDFGITPIEAMAAGTPVIAYKKGGALDYIEPGKTGEFFEKQTTASLVSAINKFNPSAYRPNSIKSFAKGFSEDSFRESIARYVKTRR